MKLDFENTLVNRYNDEKIPYDPHHWNDLRNQLSVLNTVKEMGLESDSVHGKSSAKHTSRKLIIAYAFGLLGLLGMSVTAFYFLSDRNHLHHNIAKTTDTNVHSQHQNIHSSPSNETINIVTPKSNSVNRSNNQSQQISHNHKLIVNNTNRGEAHSEGDDKHQVGHESSNQMNQSNNGFVVIVPVSYPGLQGKNILPSLIVNQNKVVNDNAAQLLENNMNLYDFVLPQETPDKKSWIVGLTGGLLSGSKQNGLTGSMAVSKQIGNEFFIESDLGIISCYGTEGKIGSNFTNNQANGLSISNSFDNATLDNEELSSNAKILDNKNLNFRYVVFNPSVGLKITDKISVKLGADVQRITLSDPQNTLVKIENRFYRIAQYDLGVTPRLAYKINKNVQSELVYRNSINSSIYGDEYWNRNYFVLQLNYGIN